MLCCLGMMTWFHSVVGFIGVAVGAVGCYKQQAMTKEESEGEGEWKVGGEERARRAKILAGVVRCFLN